jgi:hypothetical protein
VEKPRCKTCLYFNLRPVTDDLPNPDKVGGCRSGQPPFPYITERHWCREHPDFRYWEAYQKGTLQWILWNKEGSKPITYLQGVVEGDYSNSTVDPRSARLFSNSKEAEAVADRVHKGYYPEEARYKAAPVIINLAEGTWQD